MRARSAVALAALAVAGAVGARPHVADATARAAAAAVEHRAAVVVDTGTGVTTACVRFTEATITGKQALERAGVDPVFADYGGNGTAVCALCGTGCSSGDCLTCDARNYWAYHRAAAGSTSYTYSQAGAGSTTVRDGDVEGWRWGSGGPPPFFSIEQVCGVPATTTTSAAPSTTTTSTTRTAPTSRSAPTTPTTTPGVATTSSLVPSSTPTTAQAAVTATSTAGDDASLAAAQRPAAASGGDDGEAQAGSALGSTVGFAGALAVLGAVGWRARLLKRRRASIDSGRPNR